jgi:uncharacterized protein (DUF433 family)
MVLDLPTEQVPLRTDDHGVIRIGGSRVTLDSVIAVFETGATPEDIVRSFPTLDLADVYAVVTYFLRHEPEIREYLARRHEQEEEARAESDRRFDRTGVRERLMARRLQQQD